MTAENSRRGEFAQLVTDHVLGHEQFHELPAIVHQEVAANEVRHDRAIAGPGFDRLAVAARLPLDFLEQLFIDVRAFFERSAHATPRINGAEILQKSTIFGNKNPQESLCTSWGL